MVRSSASVGFGRSACGEHAPRGKATTRNRARRGWCACPASPCPAAFGQRFLHHRRGVDEHLDLRPARAMQPAGGLLELALEDIVIVAAPGVDRNRCPVAAGKAFERVGLRAVVHAGHDDRARLGPERIGMRAARGVSLHPAHVAMPAIGEEPFQTPAGGPDRVGRGEADGVEPFGQKPSFSSDLMSGDPMAIAKRR